MALPGFKATAVDGSGNTLGATSVEVRLQSDNSLATLYSDKDATTPIANPFNADANGDFEFYAAQDIYNVTLGAGSSPQTFPAILVNATQIPKTPYDFGAVGDGVTDDREAIQAAIDYYYSIGGGIVFFPPGTFIVSKTPGENTGLLLKDGVTLVGSGVDVTTIKCQDGAGNLHAINTPDGVTSNIGIRDLTVDHNGYNIAATTGVHGVRLSDCQGVRLTRIKVKDTDQHALLTTSSNDLGTLNKDIFLTDVEIENAGVSGRAGGDGVRIYLGVDNLNINGLVVRTCELHGLHAGKGTGTISNVQIFDSGQEAISMQSEGFEISNVHAEWNNITCDLIANRPVSGTAGALFYASDTATWSRYTGTTWTTGGINPTGFKVFTRSGGFATARRSSATNVKLVMNVTENQPFVPPSSDGLRIDANDINVSNLSIAGPFRFAVQLEENASRNNISGVTIEGANQEAVRVWINANNNNISGLKVVSANTVGGSNPQIRVRGINNTFSGCHLLDETNTAKAISEESAANGNIIIGCVLRGTSVTGPLNLIGADTVVRNCDGFKNEGFGSGTIASGLTSVSVSHGNQGAPTFVSVTASNNPTNDPGNIWISSISGSSFTVNCQNDPGASGLSFTWYAGNLF